MLKAEEHAYLWRGLQEGAVGIRHWRQAQLGQIRRAARRSSKPPAPNLRHHVHLAFGLLQALSTPGLIIHEPFRKPDGTLDRQPRIANRSEERRVGKECRSR